MKEIFRVSVKTVHNEHANMSYPSLTIDGYEENFGDLARRIKVEVEAEVTSLASSSSIGDLMFDLGSATNDHDHIEITQIKERGSKMNVNKMFSKMNLQFGKIDNGSIVASPFGIAVRHNGDFIAYDATGGSKSVDGMVFEDAPVFKMPVAIDKIDAGDIILHQNKYFSVLDIEGDKITAINIGEAKEETLLPVKSPFGFNFYTKIVSPFSTMFSSASEDQPVGDTMPLMMLSMMGDNDGDDNGMSSMMMMMAMMGKDSMGDMGNMFSNPMMMMAMMGNKGGSSNMMEMMMLSQLMK